MSEWEKICDYLTNDPECKEVHKLLWPSNGWAYITKKSGVRVKINWTWTLEQTKSFIQHLNENDDQDRSYPRIN